MVDDYPVLVNPRAFAGEAGNTVKHRAIQLAKAYEHEAALRRQLAELRERLEVVQGRGDTAWLIGQINALEAAKRVAWAKINRRKAGLTRAIERAIEKERKEREGADSGERAQLDEAARCAAGRDG